MSTRLCVVYVGSLPSIMPLTNVKPALESMFFDGHSNVEEVAMVVFNMYPIKSKYILEWTVERFSCVVVPAFSMTI